MNTPDRSPDPWAGLLDKDEEIIWQGQPDSAFKSDLSQPMSLAMGVIFMAFSTFWMIKSSIAPGPFWMFGLIFFGIGFYNAIGVHFWKTYKLNNTHYTLTSKRAFIAVQLPWTRKLDSYQITDYTPLSYTDVGALGTIAFAEKKLHVINNTLTSKIGFEYIETPRDVWALIKTTQRNNT